MSERSDRSEFAWASMVIALIFGIVVYFTYVEMTRPDRRAEPVEVNSKVTRLLATDSSGCKIFRVECDGHVFIINTQGGIVEVKP